MLIINADDWGAADFVTNRILECIKHGIVNSTSAMVFMKDSVNAAELARVNNVDTGLHLNLTTQFTESGLSSSLLKHQDKLISYLRNYKISQLIYNPFLHNQFEYVFKAQYEEYERLYSRAPLRIDGHHHMHLCANMLIGDFIPHGKRVRRNFTFINGEKNLMNRTYRAVVDLLINRRYISTRYFISIRQISNNEEKKRIAALNSFLGLARTANLEIMIHPHQEQDFEYVLCDQFTNELSRIPRCSFAELDSGKTIHQNKSGLLKIGEENRPEM